MTNQDLFQTAIDIFGESNQVEKAIEECSELISAVIRFSHGRGNKEQVIDEIADVFITANQLRLIFGEEEVDERIKVKLGRLATLLGIGERE